MGGRAGGTEDKWQREVSHDYIIRKKDASLHLRTIQGEKKENKVLK